MGVRLGQTVREFASTSYAAANSSSDSIKVPRTTKRHSPGQAVQLTKRNEQSVRPQAVVNYDRPTQRSRNSSADTDTGMEGRRNSAKASAYVSLSEAQQRVSDAVEKDASSKPGLLSFLDNGAQSLRFLNYALNGGLLGLAIFGAASHLLAAPSADGPLDFATSFSANSHGLWDYYEYMIDTHPLLTKAAISGAVYGLGDLTAQTYEGRGWKNLDLTRILRSSLCGLIAFGPLSHFFYQQLDRFFIISKYFDGGDAWFTPAAKIFVDQTLFAATWNSLYLVMLGALKATSPEKIAKTVKESWWDNLKAGWRIWPLVHIITYTFITCDDRVLWVNMVELAWVTVLCFYGQQKRERAGAAACALPGVAGEGGVFTDDILRSMSVESQIVFQKADDAEPIVKRLDEVLVEAALLEANFISSPNNPAFPQPAMVKAASPMRSMDSQDHSRQ